MYYYENLKKIRKNKKISQTDIAKLLNTTQETYQRWECGQREIPLHHAITLAAYYGVTLDYLILDKPG